MELPDDVLEFFFRKGGFLLLIDSLNEIPDDDAKKAFGPFLTSFTRNRVLFASQTDVLRRPSTAVFRLMEITDEQARYYLIRTTGNDVWDRLPTEARQFGRNPQNLALLAEILTEVAPEKVPVRRADLYRAIVERDTAVQQWFRSDSIEMQLIYELAFRMLYETRYTVKMDEATEIIRAQLPGDSGQDDEIVQAVLGAIRKSRIFKEEIEHDSCGISTTVVSFQHELIGKFLAARFVRLNLFHQNGRSAITLSDLTREHRFLEVFFFCLDEISSSRELTVLLSEVLKFQDSLSLKIVAYALATKEPNLVSEEIRIQFNAAQLAAELKDTPAAATSALAS